MTFSLVSSLRYDPRLAESNIFGDPEDVKQYMLLPLHVERLVSASERHGWRVAGLSVEVLKLLCDAAVLQYFNIHGQQRAPLKIRILLSESGVLSAHASAVIPLSDSAQIDPRAIALYRSVSLDSSQGLPFVVLNIALDTEATPSSIYTSTKTTSRAHYDAARSRVGVPPLGAPSPSQILDAPDDVLMYNATGEITETSIRNVALFRAGNWITPAESTGCLPGVMRKQLLKAGLIHEARSPEVLKLEKLRSGEAILLFNGVEGCRLGRLILPHVADTQSS